VLFLMLLGLMADVDQSRISIYVGPVVRDGFVDADRDVADSIADLRKEMRKRRIFTVMSHEASVLVKLSVTRDQTFSDAGYVGGVIGNTGWVVPNVSSTNVLTTELRTKTHRKVFVATCGRWKQCASRLTQDIAAWVRANSVRIAAGK
jgi:hypothetical protein